MHLFFGFNSQFMLKFLQMLVMIQHKNTLFRENRRTTKMLVSENGKLIELPDDIRMGDEYQIYDQVIVIYYANKRMYSIYTKKEEGLHLERKELKSKPRFFESGFILAKDSDKGNVLYNTELGTVVATGNFFIGEYSNPDVWKGNTFRAVVLKFYENCEYTYRVFDDQGNEVLDSKYVKNGWKVELLDFKGFGNMMPLKIRDDRFESRRYGVLHILFLKDGTSEVIEVIPPEYDKIYLNCFAAVKDYYGNAHYPTYVAQKNDKETCFTITGKRIRLPKK